MTDSLETLALRVQLASFAGPSLAPAWAALIDEGLGGVCLFGSNLTGSRDDVAGLVASLRGLRADLVVATDEEGGDVTRLHVREASPVLGAAALGAIDDADLTRAVGAAVGDDVAGVGIDLVLGPVADVNSDPDNPVIGTRSFGTDPALVARHVAAWTSGVQRRGVAACVKHFPGHGDTSEDSHLTLPVLHAGPDQLRARELPPFASAVSAGTAAVMTSHLRVAALDPMAPATLSQPILSLLRDDLGFDGVVVSDALDMAGASADRGIPATAVSALAAGCDLLCTGPDKDAALVREIQAAVVAAVRAGLLSETRLVDAARRVARLRRTPAPTSVDHVSHAALVERVRTAFVVEGELPDLTGARLVSIDTEANIAVGPGQWGVPADRVAVGEPLPDGPVVIQVRDAHRRPDVAAMLAGLPGPGLVVEWGWPGPRTGWERAPLARLCTRGNGRPAIDAVRKVLAEAGWQR